MTAWIERYRRQAEERFQRLDEVLASLPDLPAVRITREFDAPPEKVFRAHVDPDLVGLLDSFESRDGMVASGMEVGIREGYERLDELLAR